MNKKESEKLAEKLRVLPVQKASNILIDAIGNIQYPIDEFEEDINISRIMERVFDTKNKGLNLKANDIKTWSTLFEKIEEILNISVAKLSIYCQIVLRETLAHRYSDYFRFKKKKEEDFNRNYGFAFEHANINNFYLRKDSSSFWNGTAYLRCGKIAKAAPFFVRVLENRLSYGQIRMHQLKTQASFDFFINFPEYTPPFIEKSVELLLQQNMKCIKLLGAGIPDTIINKYKNRWLNE